MESKENQQETENLKKTIELKKDRIQKLRRLNKLKANDDLISEYDSLIKTSENIIFNILESREIPDPNKEQVILRSHSRVRLIVKGLKQSILETDKQIDLLNKSIENDNIRLKSFTGKKTEHGGAIV